MREKLGYLELVDQGDGDYALVMSEQFPMIFDWLDMEVHGFFEPTGYLYSIVLSALLKTHEPAIFNNMWTFHQDKGERSLFYETEMHSLAFFGSEPQMRTLAKTINQLITEENITTIKEDQEVYSDIKKMLD